MFPVGWDPPWDAQGSIYYFPIGDNDQIVRYVVLVNWETGRILSGISGVKAIELNAETVEMAQRGDGMISKLIGLAAASLMMAGAVAAQELPSAKMASKQLYKTRKNSTIVRILVPDLVPAPYQAALENAAKLQKYYEAMAASPTEGMLAESAVHAINHHSAAAAHKAAISGCNAKKKKASKSCVVIAEFLPKGYTGPQSFSLSFNASDLFAKKYKRAGKSKAFAISTSTGHWGDDVKADSVEAAKSAALAACATKAAKDGGDDCAIVSVD